MRLVKSDLKSKNVVENLMQLYLHDISIYTGERLDNKGLYRTGKYFDLYWTDKNRFAYLCIVDEQPIGFALVRELAIDEYSLAEFFILSSMRRQGLATKFAQEVFKQHLGQWTIAQMESNTIAHSFWVNTISVYTKGNFSEGWSDSQPYGPKQIFDNNLSCTTKTRQ